MIQATPLRADGRGDRPGSAASARTTGPRPAGRPLPRAGVASGNCIVRCVEENLARNYSEQITLRDIEKSSGYSVYQIIRTFRRRLGITPHAYLTLMRLHYAAEKLLQGDTIAGAAAEAGFSDQSHMTRHFKRVFGTTPRQYLLDQRRASAQTRGPAALA
ncbi:AraC family transcriptional regulator [Microbaculum marinum]|uniref:AraC family transcriptional regulator n=1 Tax=Microbaculum marinum TaxID=1764581 RepID=A0AAW9RPB7_9HYPH